MPSKIAERILVVDDDPLSRRLLRHSLSKCGYTPGECASGVEALRIVREQPQSLLLLDFDMPDLNGADVLKKLRADRDPSIAQIPAIMLTGHGGEESEVRCLEAGANDFVTKPINIAVLCARIETQLRLREMRRQLEKQNDELEAWRGNLERDLEAARLTQQSLIPQNPPALAGWDVAAIYRPVIQVGGDIYGWLRMRDGRTLFWIADATGHGASAALMTTLAKLLFQHGTAEHNSPSEIMAAVNHDFRTIFGARSFMTAMCVALDAQDGRASIVGAGHPPLIVQRKNGVTETIFSSAPPLGLASVGKNTFDETMIELHPGDAFLLYTDGLSGAEDGSTRRTPIKRLVELLPKKHGSARALLDGTLENVIPNQREKAMTDDIAALAVRRSE
jgi:sigma-B regulation protein RsbU (phosphoserine phosphatase)